MPPKILYLVTEDWYFVSHRLPMARAARAAGYEVHVATRVERHATDILAEGFQLHPIGWNRGSLNPIGLFQTIRAVRTVYRRIAPDLAHHVALQPVLVGSLAALGLKFVRLNALTGLGFLFASQSRAALLRIVLMRVLKTLLSGPRAFILVQNADDRAFASKLGAPEERTFLIRGSGIDVDHFVLMPEPEGQICAGFVGRLLDDKGIRTLVQASAILAERGRPIHLFIAGEPDPANPASLSENEIKRWSERADITYLGHISDVRKVWERAHIAVLPSRREGLPKSLLEAAACGRAIVATDVPGCREVARAGVNALLVPPDDPEALANALDKLASDVNLRRQFALSSRRLAEQDFSSERIGTEIMALYRQLLESAPPRR